MHAYWYANVMHLVLHVSVSNWFLIIIKNEQGSPEATTLLKPEDCKSLLMNFIEKIKPVVTGARSRQVYFTLVSHYMFIW
jgi:hypothetical protein